MHYAYIVPTRRHFPRFYEERIYGVTLLRCELPNEKRRTLRRCALTLERCGVRRMLNSGLNGRFPLVSTRVLWQENAARLALLWLEREQLPPEKAVVCLRSNRVTQPFLHAAETLSDHVRAIALDLPEPEPLADHLRQRNGVPVLRCGGDVTLSFRGEDTESSGSFLCVGGVQPVIPGFALTAPVHPPADCPKEGLYAALCHGGRLSAAEVTVVLVGDSESL